LLCFALLCFTLLYFTYLFFLFLSFYFFFLGSGKVTQKLAQLVKEISSGNAFWCKTIANFISENGDEEFMDAIKIKANITNSLQYLVVCLFEKLSSEQQMVAKYASIIGHEFNDTVLRAVLPTKPLSILKEILEGKYVSLCVCVV
jgi:predicted ATPase